MDFSDPPPPYTPQQNYGKIKEERSEAHSPRPVSIITQAARRSMEDELRELPDGWVRQYDSESGHQFYVDTSKRPPRSIWHHPYDDDEYLSNLSSSGQRRPEALNKEIFNSLPSSSSSVSPNGLNETTKSRPGVHNFGRKLKDILTSTTHEERAEARRERDRMEMEAYRRHQKIRDKTVQASITGVPQLIRIDNVGKEIWIKAPSSNVDRNGSNSHLFGQNYRMTYMAHGTGGLYRSCNRFSGDPYVSRNAVGNSLGYNHPYDAYHRPTGSSVGGGMGLPLGLGLAGGMLFGSIVI